MSRLALGSRFALLSRFALVFTSALLALAGAVVGCGAKSGLEVPDAARVAELDAGVPPLCLEVPLDAGPVRAALTTPVALAMVDVFFLVDATGSMSDEIENIRAGLSERVVPGVRAVIPDAWFGLGFLGEFPLEPYGPPDVLPYTLSVPMTSDSRRLESALTSAPVWGNFDDPEAQVEALYQVATGEGLGEWVPPSSGCAMGGEGGACFRESALPVVVLITDAPMHDGPPGIEPIAPYEIAAPLAQPHTYEQLLEALAARGVLVLGLGATDSERPSSLPHLRALARDTGAVSSSGAPLTFDIGSAGDGVGAGIVRAIERLAAEVPLDVEARVEDVPGDGVDATPLLRGVRPLRADPADGARGTTATGFLGVVPGTRVSFEVTVDASALPPSSATRRYPARVVFVADGRSRLGTVSVLLVVPGTDGGGCP